MIVHAENDFRTAVEPRLDIRVHCRECVSIVILSVHRLWAGPTFLVLETAAAKVDDFDGTLRRIFEQNILWLQIAVNDTMVPEE